MIFDAVVLAGGRSSRLGGQPKSQLIFEGSTLLQRTLDAVRDARQTVIVGEVPAAAASSTTIVTREYPLFGGPAAGLAAALRASSGERATWIVVLACDMPFVARAVPVLLANVAGDGVLAVDDTGRAQYLLACYRRAALDAALDGADGSPAGRSVRGLIAALDTVGVAVPAGSSLDIDTWSDAAALNITTEAGTHHDRS